jgi:hypothetical protein
MIANVDIINANGQGVGDVAKTFLSRGKIDPLAMRPYLDTRTGFSYITVHTGGSKVDPRNYKRIPITTNATLLKDEWKLMDDTVTKIAEERLQGVADVKSRGLTYSLSNAMGTTILEWEDQSDAMEAVITMDGVPRGLGDRPEYKINYMPVPIVHVDFEINARVLESSRNRGDALDTTSLERATRRINEKLEEMLFTNTTYSYGEKDDYGRNKIYSYLSFPDRSQYTISTSWTSLSATSDQSIGEQVYDDVASMKQQAINGNHYGPWILYIPRDYEVLMDRDYIDNYPKTLRQRLLEIGGLDEIKVVDKLPDDNVLLVEMSTSTVRWVEGVPITTVQWSTEGQFVYKFKVMTIQFPQIRSDYNKQCGIVHGSV